MTPYGKQSYLKKKVSYHSKENSEKIFSLNIKLIHKIFDTINISLLVFIFILFFSSFNSQRKWSNTYKNLSKTKVINNNLIDYISNTEEVYIDQLESLKKFKKTKPKDLIYLDRILEKKESPFNKTFSYLIEGISDSRYQRGY